jgi:murein DD-endopeptidase MepM/ murein hydrolase activator NlpD
VAGAPALAAALALTAARGNAGAGWVDAGARVVDAAAGAADAGAGPAAGVELALPFDGTWGVLQGFDSGETHTGYAAYALDFAPPQRPVPLARVRHPRLGDFACYGRPILAPADGTVVRVATGFRDLPPYAGARLQVGGNFVIIQHAPAVYTELVHLMAGSVRVKVGATVRRGQPIARCGNSGNATTPHLHLGLLSSITPITTARMSLSRYQVLGPEGAWIPGDGEPQKGQWLRPAP